MEFYHRNTFDILFPLNLKIEAANYKALHSAVGGNSDGGAELAWLCYPCTWGMDFMANLSHSRLWPTYYFHVSNSTVFVFI